MDINEIPEVEVKGVGYKFIVAVLTHESGATKIVVRSDDNYFSHADVFHQLMLETGNLACDCLGGGYMKFDSDKKRIYIWDYSQQFGHEPDRNITVSILQKKFPDFKVITGIPR